MAAPARTARRATQTLALALTLALAGAANAGSLEDARAQNAVRVLADIQAIPSRRSPTSCWTRRARSWSCPTRSRPAW